MKKLLLSIVSTLLFVHFVSAQVGIGTENPSPSTQLEVASKDRGILIPRVSLTSSTDKTTVLGGKYENSLLVFNTSSVGDVTPGYYYWFETKWHKITTTTETASLEETVTTLTETFPGVFVYTSENGTVTTIDIP